jgi:hypothetical protein
VLDNLTKGEAKAIARAFDKHEKNGAFHVFIQDPDIQKRVRESLERRQEKMKETAFNAKEEYVQEDLLLAYQQVRIDLWRELSEEKKKEYEEKSKEVKADNKKKNPLSEDRCVLLVP